MVLSMPRKLFGRSSQPQQVAQFTMILCDANGNELYKTEGKGEKWQLYQDIQTEGFNGSICFSLRQAWSYALEHQLSEHQANVTGYETIRKFGEAMQLKTPAQVKLKITYQ